VLRQIQDVPEDVRLVSCNEVLPGKLRLRVEDEDRFASCVWLFPPLLALKASGALLPLRLRSIGLSEIRTGLRFEIRSLLEVEGNPLFLALISDQTRPSMIEGPSVRPGFPSGNNPVDVIQIYQSEVFKQRFK